MTEMRDIDEAYRLARIADHATYLKAGQRERAEQVARVLRDRHGYDVGKQRGGEAKDEPGQESPTPETTAADPAPEAAVEPKPAARRPGRPPRQAGK
ncbi:hypothetical protein [Streptomyces sp. DW26H14]|uniref:hypothetical protein n=1 Tax=Streptomyces sp. DW26H14 TaxID=3435395 RepID=UPI00403E1A71